VSEGKEVTQIARGGKCSVQWSGRQSHSFQSVHGELLSYLFLAREFLDELIALSRRDAERWLDARHDAGLWQVGRLPDGTTDKAPAPGTPRKRKRKPA